jgi:serine phosphatase RsbU (regulator of sigma subunit)/tetratricopeptide (TPR) repeat protein
MKKLGFFLQISKKGVYLKCVVILDFIEKWYSMSKLYLRYVIQIFLGVCLCVFFPSVGKAQDINELLEKLNKATLPTERLALNSQIGLAYQKQNAHKKATEYFEKAYQLSKEQRDTKQTPLLLRGLAQSYTELKDYKNATNSYQRLLETYAQQTDEVGELRCLQALANLAKLNGQDNESINFYSKALELQKKRNDTEGLTSTYNNLGYLYKRVGNTEQSLKNFNDALALNKNATTQAQTNIEKITMLTNLGVCYANLSDFRQAQNYFSDALVIAEKGGNSLDLAKIHNYLAANYYVSGNNSQALSTAQKALEYGNATQNEEVLMTTYRILADIYQKDNDIREYQRYNQLYQDTKNRLADKEVKQRQQILQNQIEIEKAENELKTLIAERDRAKLEQDKQAAEIARNKAEIERKQEEVARLKSDQIAQEKELKNRALQQQQTEQALQLAKQQALRAESEQKLLEQKALQAETDRKLKVKEYEELKNKEEREKRESEMKLLKAKNESQAQQSRYNQNIFWLALAIVGLVLIFVLTSLYFSQRARRALASKNQEIEAKRQELMASHEELQQNQEEILAQREFIGEQNRELSKTNQRLKDNEGVLRKSIEKLKASEEMIKLQNQDLQEREKQISSSISAAKTIQTAILPYPAKLNQLLREYFIIYRPKDVVSGDFYWLNEVDGRTIFIVADCTGHGVPGAFMTLIGSSLLDKIVRVWDIHDPVGILERLHQEIRIVLRQDDDTNNSGMDMIVVQMTDTNEGRNIVFSGAKNSLYYVKNGELGVLKGDRKSIGGDQNENRLFTNQNVFLPKGSFMYLSSDGFIDQNDVRRKRFGEPAFIKMLADVAHLPIMEQQKTIEQTLDTYMTNTYQRDDIVLIGVKV